MKNKKLEITKLISNSKPDIRHRTHSGGDRYIDGFRLFADSNAVEASSEFFYGNAICDLDYKSRVWNNVSRISANAVCTAIRKVFNLPYSVDVKFSAKAGCSCGCSPGYVVKPKDHAGMNFLQENGLSNKNIFMSFVHNIDEYQSAMPKFKKDLENEIANRS